MRTPDGKRAVGGARFPSRRRFCANSAPDSAAAPHRRPVLPRWQAPPLAAPEGSGVRGGEGWAGVGKEAGAKVAVEGAAGSFDDSGKFRAEQNRLNGVR